MNKPCWSLQQFSEWWQIYHFKTWPLALNRSPFLSRYFSYPNLWILSCFRTTRHSFFSYPTSPADVSARDLLADLCILQGAPIFNVTHWSHFMMSRTTNARTKQKCVWIYMRGWIVIKTQIAYHCSHFVSYRYGIHVHIHPKLSMEQPWVSPCSSSAWKWRKREAPKRGRSLANAHCISPKYKTKTSCIYSTGFR